jgi:hypothetical protein
MGKLIHKVSSVPEEDEVLFLPNTQFRFFNYRKGVHVELEAIAVRALDSRFDCEDFLNDEVNYLSKLPGNIVSQAAWIANHAQWDDDNFDKGVRLTIARQICNTVRRIREVTPEKERILLLANEFPKILRA